MMRLKLVVPVLAAALLAGCGSDGPTGDGGGGTKVTVEASRATHDSIGVAGGTITATATNGVTYTLTVPAGALVQPTRITMTPIAAEEGLPVSGGFAAGVTLEPSGLHFARAVRLALSHVSAAPSGMQLVALTFEGDGDSLTLAPLADSSGVAMTLLTHFSGGAFGFGTTADVQLLLQASTTDVGSQRFINQLAAFGPVTGPNPAALPILQQWFSSEILPELQGATSDAELILAIVDYDVWATDAELYLTGRVTISFTSAGTIAQAAVPASLATEVGKAAQAAAAALRSAITGNNDVCRTNHDVQAMLNVMLWQGFAQYFRVDTPAEQLDQATILNNLCARVVEVRHSLADPLPIGQAKTLDLTFALEFSDGTRARSPLFQVTVAAAGATIQNPQGFTDSTATWGGSVITAQQSSVTIVATACFLEPGTATVTPICGVDNIAIGSQQFTKVGVTADLGVNGGGAASSAACSNHNQTNVGLSSATASASKNCTIFGASLQNVATATATLLDGDFVASLDQTTPNATANAGWLTFLAVVAQDRIVIDAPGLTGTQGTFTPGVALTGQLAPAAFLSLNSGGVIGASWEVKVAAFPVGGTAPNVLDVTGGNRSSSNGSQPFGPQLPATVRSSTPITFTYGTPFVLQYEVIFSEGGNLVPFGPLPASSTASSIHYRWLGMSGLPAGAVVHSDSGIDWSQASP